MDLWKQFEHRIKNEANINPTVTCIRIRDDVRVIGNGKPIRSKSEFDFTAAIDGQAMFFDAKETQDARWNLKEYCLYKTKVHQWNALKSAHEKGAMAGYLVWFSTLNSIVWAPIPALLAAIERDEKCLTITTIGCSSQSDNEPIDLQALVYHELYPDKVMS
jgi:penicillin-binding protein-related factor A (putative recombinase)